MVDPSDEEFSAAEEPDSGDEEYCGGEGGRQGDDVEIVDPDELAMEAIRELSLMGAIDSIKDVASITRAAAQCAGRECSSVRFQDLIGALLETVLVRSSPGDIDDLVELENKMEAWRPPHGNPGSLDALATLRSRRLLFPVVSLKVEVVEDPEMAANPGILTIGSFLRNVDMRKTKTRTLILVARLLWPEASKETHEFLDMNVSDTGSTFDTVWKTGTSFSTDAFTAALRAHTHSSIQGHSFVRSVIPGLMKYSVLSFEKLNDRLEFSLDDGSLPSKRTEYILDYYTGEIVGSKGMGVVHHLFGMKRFFTGDGGVIMMAEVLADLGIGRMLRYDTSTGGWR